MTEVKKLVQDDKQAEHQDSREPSGCHSDSVHRPSLPSCSPSSLCFIFLHTFITGYIYVCIWFSLSPQNVSPVGRDSVYLVTAVSLSGEQYLAPGRPSAFAARLVVGSSALPWHCQTVVLSLLAPLIPSSQKYTTSLPQTPNTNLRAQGKTT